MSQLTLTAIPGFFDIATTTISAGQALTDDSLQKISNNAKFAVVHKERIYMGFYKNGDTVGVPKSPIDNYQYQRSEVQYDFKHYSTRAPGAAFVSGQAARPAQADSSTAAIYWTICDVDDSTGDVLTQTSYWDGSHETITNDGIVKVYAECTRLSQNEAN